MILPWNSREMRRCATTVYLRSVRCIWAMGVRCKHKIGCLAVSLLSDYICPGPPGYSRYMMVEEAATPSGAAGLGTGLCQQKLRFRAQDEMLAGILCGNRDIPGSCCSKASRNNWIILQRPHGKAAGFWLFSCCCQRTTADPCGPALH